MTRELITSLFALTACLTSCGQTNTSTGNQKQQQSSIAIDTSLIAILPFDTTQHWIFKGNKPTSLTNDDLLKIETVLNDFIKDYNPDQERQFKEINHKHPEYKLDKRNFIIDLARYKRQYIATINAKGEKEVWINCFCNTHNRNWRQQIIGVRDGGNCYFNLKINLTTGKYYDLMVNGDA